LERLEITNANTEIIKRCPVKRPVVLSRILLHLDLQKFNNTGKYSSIYGVETLDVPPKKKCILHVVHPPRRTLRIHHMSSIVAVVEIEAEFTAMIVRPTTEGIYPAIRTKLQL
jgi:hypothetical protein